MAMCDCEKQIENLINSVFLVKNETWEVKQELEWLREKTSLRDLINEVSSVKSETERLGERVKQEFGWLREGTSLLDLKQEVSSVNNETDELREDIKEIHQSIKEVHQSIQQLNRNVVHFITDVHKDSQGKWLLISSIHLILLALILFKLW